MLKNNFNLPVDKYISPQVIFYEFNKLIKEHGQDALFAQRKFQVDREMWISSLFAFGLLGLTSKVSWIKAVDDTTPDTEVVSFEKVPRGKNKLLRNVEVMEYTKHSEVSLKEEVRKKLVKSYPADYNLLIFVTSPDTYHHDEMVKLVSSLKPKLKEVWILGGNTKSMSLWQAFPDPMWVTFNPVDAANTWPNDDHILNLKRGFED